MPVHACHGASVGRHVEVRRQLTGDSFLLLPCGLP